MGHPFKNTKAENTRKQIMDTYLTLIKDNHWEKITVKEIYTNAGITRGTFYQYFSNIYDLMEQVETPLLEELSRDYQSIQTPEPTILTPNSFIDKFDISPPEPIIHWFEFCMKHKVEMQILLSPNSDPYFIVKLREIIVRQINRMMDLDGMPKDDLRDPFIRTFSELHFLSARTWLNSKDDEFLSTDEIIHLLNTMRIGANYLAYVHQKK